jgi:tetratricopeptide (TPR) repeat protein
LHGDTRGTECNAAEPHSLAPVPSVVRIDNSSRREVYNPASRGAAMRTLFRRIFWLSFARCGTAAHILKSAVVVITLALCVALAPHTTAAQASSNNVNSSPGWPLHDSSPVHASADGIGSGGLPLLVQPDESCLLWAMGKKNAPTVSAANLKAPQEARDEYKKACTELKERHFDLAGQHLHKAVEIDPTYPGAWALLGQVLEAQQQIPEAKSACSQASSADSAYAPAYLCLSDLAGQQNDWEHSREFADRALALDPVQNAYGHFYLAVAQVHLGSLATAESSAHDAIDADHEHHIPQAHLLLAQIYGSQNQLPRAADELKAYLKVAHNASNAAEIRKTLAQVESQINKQ